MLTTLRTLLLQRLLPGPDDLSCLTINAIGTFVDRFLQGLSDRFLLIGRHRRHKKNQEGKKEAHEIFFIAPEFLRWRGSYLQGL